MGLLNKFMGINIDRTKGKIQTNNDPFEGIPEFSTELSSRLDCTELKNVSELKSLFENEVASTDLCIKGECNCEKELFSQINIRMAIAIGIRGSNKVSNLLRNILANEAQVGVCQEFWKYILEELKNVEQRASLLGERLVLDKDKDTEHTEKLNEMYETFKLGIYESLNDIYIRYYKKLDKFEGGIRYDLAVKTTTFALFKALALLTELEYRHSKLVENSPFSNSH